MMKLQEAIQEARKRHPNTIKDDVTPEDFEAATVWLKRYRPTRQAYTWPAQDSDVIAHCVQTYWEARFGIYREVSIPAAVVAAIALDFPTMTAPTHGRPHIGVEWEGVTRSFRGRRLRDKNAPPL